jgi:epoxyqueuosine reductase
MAQVEQRARPAELAERVAHAAVDLGFDLVGVTPAGPSLDFARFQQWLAAGYDGQMAYLAHRMAERADLRLLLPEARSAIVLGVSYHSQELPATLRNDPSRGQIAAYAWGDDYHEAIKPLLFQLDAAIRAASGRTTLGRAYVDTGPVLERSWAQEAGLGFIGKNACLIAPRLGSWTFLALLLTPEEIAPFSLLSGGERQEARAPAQSCGACTRCLDVCPTHALVAPHLLDGRRCISYLTIELRGAIPHPLRPQMGNWIFGCDLCQEICPYNRRFARPARLAALQARPEVVAPRLLDLLALDEAGFRQRFRRSPVLRAKRRGLLRNVCVALGNWGDPVVVPALVEALHDDEPLVRGHAAWALGRIAVPAARQALWAAEQSEPDRSVRDELAAALASRDM